jgi:rare lipoprotein A
MVVRVGAATCVAAMLLGPAATLINQSGDAAPGNLTAAAAGPAISGAASTYNPYLPEARSGGTETASGESYDPGTWTAAIQADLREQFGGVHYGKDYRPAYALVASADKQVIVKINDVGPLEPGRVIDLNERAMRYFDPSLERGVISAVVTPLLGDDWPTGPIAGNTG